LSVPGFFFWGIEIPQQHIPTIKACIDQWNYFRKYGKYYQTKHLYQGCLEAAKEKEDKEAEWQTLAIIQQEMDKSFW
jgi:hypothetical protein